MVLVNIRNNASDKQGRKYKVVIHIEETTKEKKYPEGVKAVYKLFRLNTNGEEELIVLMDNHQPYGFHEHPKLPSDKNVREPLGTTNWKEVRSLFQEKCKEKFNES